MRAALLVNSAYVSWFTRLCCAGRVALCRVAFNRFVLIVGVSWCVVARRAIACDRVVPCIRARVVAFSKFVSLRCSAARRLMRLTLRL